MSEGPRPRLVVTADLPCRRCRYPLRGADVTGRCSECGLPIEETLRSSIDLSTVGMGAGGGGSPRRLAVAMPMLGVAALVASVAGLALPWTIVTTPGGFDVSGRAGAGSAAMAILAPITTALGLASGLSAMVLVAALLIGVRRGASELAARMPRSLTIGSVLLAASMVAGLWPRATGMESLAAAISSGLGSLLHDGGSVPDPAVAVPIVVDLARGLGLACLVVGLSALLEGHGSRSEWYARAGQGLQAGRPLVAAIVATLVGEVGWTIGVTFQGRGGPGGLGRIFESMPWEFGWLVAAAVVALGCLYLAANAIWATTPWRVGVGHLDALVGPATETLDDSAGMADDPPGGRSA